MSDLDLYYQMLSLDGSYLLPDPTAVGQQVGAGVQLLQQGVLLLNNLGLSRRVNRELVARAKEIRASIPQGGGVLVCVGIQEWEHADPTGARAKEFLTLVIAGSGYDPTAVLRGYVMAPHLRQGAPRGWVRRDVYLWVTK